MMAAPWDSARTGGHIPVLLNEVIHALAPKDGETYIDGTFGNGGYTRAILNAANCRVVAIDRDPDAIARAASLKEEYGDRFQIIEGCFGDMVDLMAAMHIAAVNGIVLDIGVSSFQLDEAARGFSFQADGPLDMRMGASGETAADVVNTYSETEIADIIYKYGDEPKSRHIAAGIVKAREEQPFARTTELAGLVERVVGRARPRKGKKVTHPATKTFQALRIYVNDELGELERALNASKSLLAADGRLVVVSFHSLEDRIVKEFLAENSGRLPSVSRHMPVDAATPAPALFKLHKKSAIKPSDAEIATNPRARSSRLRVGHRSDAAFREGSDA